MRNQTISLFAVLIVQSLEFLLQITREWPKLPAVRIVSEKQRRRAKGLPIADSDEQVLFYGCSHAYPEVIG